MATVKDYYPGDFWADVKQTLNWIYSRQNAPVGGWQGNSLATPTTSAQFAECGILSTPVFDAITGAGTTVIENIVLDPPPGVVADTSGGPDGFPINFSPIDLPGGNALLNTFQNSVSLTVLGRCFNLLQALANYRVDIFSRTDLFYYQGSSTLTDAGGGVATWTVAGVATGAVIAALYPTSVAQPAPGSQFATLPAGWVAHSNTGVGAKLSNYRAQVFAKTDIEYLQESDIPIIVQDAHHARAGTSKVPGAGTLTIHIQYNDPVVGWTTVFTSLQNLAVFKDLPRSLQVPTSDPHFVADPTTTTGALQNRSWIYDAALFIYACVQTGNFAAALRVIRQLNFFLDNPSYLASAILENAEDGLTTRWTKAGNPGASITNLNDPTQPPYGNGLVLLFHAAAVGDNFTYVGSGFPDTTDTMIQFQHRETSGSIFTIEIGVTTAAGKVTKFQVTSDPAGAETWNSVTKIITVPIDLGTNAYRYLMRDLSGLISTLASDTLSSITSFKVTLNAAGDMYFDNLSVGTLQPAGSLSFSYDIYNGQIDQAYIRAGAMAWVCSAYAAYMQASLDYSPATYLQKMLNFLLTLKSTAADLRNGLYLLGYGKYKNPGYQFVPGLQTSCSIEHQTELYVAFQRANLLLFTAATQLLKAGLISLGASQTLVNLGTTAGLEATGIKNAMLAVAYFPPTAAAWTANTVYALGAKVQDSNSNIQCSAVAGTSGAAAPAWSTTLGNTTADNTVTWQLVNLAGKPGHFAQGVGATSLDVSQALDASGTLTAIFCHAILDDAKATECLKFIDQTFFLDNPPGQQILLSNVTNSWNEAYQQLTKFSGFKVYNDSPNGYSGSPVVVWQEGTWQAILALLLLHDVSSVQTYFATARGGIDAFLTKLITDQRVIRSTTGDGSMLNYSLASHDLPWEFSVWPGLSSTLWFWSTMMNSTVLHSVAPQTKELPYLIIPQGQEQSVTDREGHSSIAGLEIECIDPGGTIKGLASQTNFVGRVARLKMGFPGQNLGDFVTLSTLQIVSAGFTADGKLKISCADVQRFMKELIWTNGGPAPWQTGQAAPAQPVGRAWIANAFAVSDKNPRYVQGNPLDIYLAAMQNELGVGQDPALPQANWTMYNPRDDSSLINPNTFLDVPGILSLRDSQFSGDWFEFKLTRPVEAKQWIEDQILKVLGLYTIVRADGRLALKSMKSPLALTPVMALNEKNTMGIPGFARLPVVNVVTVRFAPDTSARETAAAEFRQEITFKQTTSIARYNQQFKTHVEANGLLAAYGGNLRAFLLADRIFKRYAFSTPKYQVKAQLGAVRVELGDFVWLNHPLAPDFLTGGTGLTNVVSEVIARKPTFADGTADFELLDTRFMNLTTPFQIAKKTDNIPVWSSATSPQRKKYMFISFNATGGLNSDGTPGNTIF